MEYMLMIYAEEGGWTKMSKTEQEQGMAAYTAYTLPLPQQAKVSMTRVSIISLLLREYPGSESKEVAGLSLRR